jgi:hypothetical protein
MREFYNPILNEANIEALIKFFTKKWDKERESGQIPRFNWKEVRKLGLFDQQKEIRNALIEYYIDHYRGQWVQMIEDFIKSKTFSTQDIEKSGIDIGGYDFEFKITHFKIIDQVIRDPRQVPSIEGEIEFVITKGDVELFGIGDVKSLTDPVNQNLDYWWEVLGEIKDIITQFLKQVILEFGFKLNIMFLTNHTYGNKVLKESTEDKKELLAKKFLDSLRLDVWHSKKYRMEYLATKKGTIIILIDTYSASIQQEIYDTLLNIFSNDEDRFVEFIEKYLISKGITITDGFRGVESSENVGELEYDEDEDDKGPRSNNIQEAKGKILPKNKFAKEYLSKFNNLKKYRSEDKDYIYLVNNSGKILVQLNLHMNETAIDNRIWNTIGIYFNERETRRKIISWLLDEYSLGGMGYVYKVDPSVLDNIGPEDTLIEKDQITESEDKNQLKDFFFKRWTKQEESGVAPKLNSKEINRLGLSNFKNDIILYYSEFMGLDPDNTLWRSELIKNYLLNNTFDENDISEMKESFDDGKIKVRFSKVELSENDNEVRNYLDLEIEFSVLSGSFYNPDENEISNFSNTENPFYDFVEYFEFKEVIEQVVESFIFETIESFGFNINNHFNYINVKWE